MLAISGLPYKDVVKQVEDTNSHLPESSRIQISLVNGPRAVVCSGPPQSLYGLNVSLRKIKAGTSEDQSRIPFSQRRIKFTSRFLPITVPFHSPHLNQVAVQLEKQIAEFSLDSLKLHLPVYETSRGEDLTGCKDLTMNLIKQITSLPVNWVAATKISASHYVDFGPGGASGIGGLTFKNKEGTGIQFLLASSLDTGSLDLLDKSFLFDNSPQSVKYAANWAVEVKCWD